MKLRKVSKTVEKSSSSDDETEEEEETTEQETSSSEVEDDTDEEDVFEPSKSYHPPPKRKKSTTYSNIRDKRKKSPLPPRRVSPRPRRISTSESSTEESLPDLEYPVDRKWKLAAAAEKEKQSTSTSLPILSSISSLGSSSENKIQPGSSSELASASLKTISKSPKKQDDSTKKSKSGENVRSLRSSDVPTSIPGPSRQFDRSVSTEKKESSSFSRITKSPNRSPDRNRNDGLGAPRSSKIRPKSPDKSDLEKSYSLRNPVVIEKKPTPTTNTTNTTPSPSPTKSVVLAIPPKRGRGRPRKIKNDETQSVVQPAKSFTPVKNKLVSIEQTSNNTTISNSLSNEARILRHRKDTETALRIKKSEFDSSATRGSTDKNIDDKKSSLMDVIDKSKTKTINCQGKLRDSSKQMRNAIALRARQSKIMAKSRVLQSNRYASGWRGVVDWKTDALRRGLTESKNASLAMPKATHRSPDIIDVYPVSVTERKISDDTLMRDLRQTASGNRSKSNHSIPRCEICDMTFTRRFSLTKHLRTLQHKKMARQFENGGNFNWNQHLQEKSKSKQSLLLRRDNLLERFNSTSKFAEPRQGSRMVMQERTRIFTHPASMSNLPWSDLRATTIELDSDSNQNWIDVEENSSNYTSDLDPSNSNMGNSDSVAIGTYNSEYLEDPIPRIDEWKSGKSLAKNKFQCDVCGEAFENKVQFSTHVFNHRAGSDLKCEECDKEFSESQDYNQHIDSAHCAGTKYVCKICPSKFNREDYLQKHMLSHKRDLKDRFMCTACDKRFSSHDLLSRHFDIKHLQLGNPKIELIYDADQRNPRVLNEPPPIMYNKNNFENCDPNLYKNGRSLEDDDINDMPAIDLELDDNNGMALNDPVPFISPDDYGREIPVEIRNPYRLNSQSSTSSYPPPRIGVLDTTSTRIGCGLKTARINPAPSYHFNPLACKDCGKLFETRKLLIKHVEYFNQAERHACQICKKKFKWRYLLNRHMVRHTRQKERMQGANVSSKLKKSGFVKQFPAAKEIPKLLPILPKRPQLPPHPPIHVYRNKHSIQFKNSTTTQKSNNSNATRARSLPSSAVGTPAITSNMKISTPSKFCIGDIVPLQSFPAIRGSSMSLKTTGLNSPGPSSGVRNFSSFEGSSATLKTRVHVCEICAKTFTDKKTLGVHLHFHRSTNLFTCTDCEAKCERKSDFELHYRCHETNQPFFLCYVCFKPFRWKKDMIRHVRKKHAEEETYRCLYCDERFKTNEELSEHISVDHSEHRSFPCDYCGKRYAQRRYLVLHIQTQHGIETNPEGSPPETGHAEFLEPEDDAGDVDISRFLITEHHM